MSISLNKLIKVNPSVIKAAGSAIDLNGVILSDNDYIPIGTGLSFKGADTVMTRFGADSDEYKAAKIYFQGYKGAAIMPSQLYFARFNRAASNAALIGANLNLTLSQLKQLSGDITLSVNGTEKTATISLADVESFSDVTTLLSDELEDVAVTYNAVTKQYKITANGDNAAKTEITVATGSLADGLGLTSATGGLVSLGSDIATADTFLTSLLAFTANWYSFTTLFEATDEQHLDFSGWVSAQQSRFNYVAWTSNGTALVSDSKETISYKINDANYSSVTPVYSLSYDKPVNVLGYCAALNFGQVNGRVQLAYRTLDGLSVDIKSNLNYDALTANGYNFYGGYAANIDSYAMWQSGIVTGDFQWLDAHAGQAWLNANIQLTIFNTLSAGFNVPYNAVGREMFATPIVTPLEQFKSWGGCSEGTDLDNNQVLQIKQALGFDGSQGLTAKGYLISIGAFNSTMRANRTTPPCYVFYADGGAFRTITLNSVEVQ